MLGSAYFRASAIVDIFTAVMISRMGLCGEGIRVNEKGGEGKVKGKKKLGGGEGRKGEEKSGKEKRCRK